MNKFAEQLKNYLEDKKISYKRAGALCDLDRSLLRRYTDGSRSPRNMKTVEKIADGLSMTEEERNNLKDSFIRSKTGERQYQMNKILDDLTRQGMDYYDCERERCNPGSKFDEQPEDEIVRNLSGEQDVEGAIRWIFTNTQKIRMVINPEYPELAKFLLQNLKEKSYQIEHIIEVDSFYGEDDVKDIQSFHEIFPLLFFSQEYRVYHHYSWRSASKESPAMNFLITEKCVFLFDRKMLHGIFSNRASDMEYYQHIFGYMKKNCGLYAMNFGGPCHCAKKKPGSKVTIDIVEQGHGTMAVFWCDKPERKIVIGEEGIVQMIKKYLELER